MKKDELQEALKELVQEGPMSDAHRSRSDHITLLRQLLSQGQTHVLEQTEDSLAFAALELLVKSLKAGEATPEMQILLADYLGEILRTDDSKAALTVLGIERTTGRPNKRRQELRTIEAYRIRIDEGEADEAALEAAWLSYFAEDGFDDDGKPVKRSTHKPPARIDPPVGNCMDQKRLEAAKKRPATSRYGSSTNAYQHDLDTIIKPLLHRAGVRARGKAGRPKSTKK